ncbi:MAG: hypothetical protein EOO43_24420 [Flavobacterium sp.]|nr:MAG: hypothetical protein EOO43_24420 [Flavobacterium sp.]
MNQPLNLYDKLNLPQQPWKRDKAIQAEHKNEKVLWSADLMKSIPTYLDTTIIIYDANNKPLKFKQYIKAVFNDEALIYLDRGKWKLQRLTKTGLDSFYKDDLSAGKSERWNAIRNPDTSKSVEIKFKKIANTLSMADYILVSKSNRKMYVKRKGVKMLEFNINLGGKPIGAKEYEGDRKTPEGVYHIDMKFDRADKFYKSFWISYPDSADKARALKKGLKPGGSVLIHGTSPERMNSKDWTNGCIALKNDEMDSLFNHVISGATIEIRK